MIFEVISKSKIKQFRKVSYSQSGEDLIVKYIFDAIGIQKPSYIDIGAHHPYYLSNTALFYEIGSVGINIEPDPTLFELFIKFRPKDTNLNIGINAKSGIIDFYIISTPTLNTFSKKEAERYKSEGNYSIERVVKINVDSIQNVIDQYYDNAFPDFLNIDAEGIDEEILRSINYGTCFPKVICVETISFSNSGNGKKNIDLIRFLEQKGYLIYADTNINSIFVRRDLWVKDL